MLLRRRYNETDTQEGVAVTKAVAPSPSSPKTENEFTEEKINKMNGSQLRKLASKNGVENPEDLTAGELKSVLRDLLVNG